jgi:hypothetical protein
VSTEFVQAEKEGRRGKKREEEGGRGTGQRDETFLNTYAGDMLRRKSDEKSGDHM